MAEQVMEDASVPYEDLATAVDEDAEIEEFRAFLESVDPSEFAE